MSEMKLRIIIRDWKGEIDECHELSATKAAKFVAETVQACADFDDPTPVTIEVEPISSD